MLCEYGLSQNTSLSKFNAFSILSARNNQCGCNFYSLRWDGKTSTNFFSFFTVSRIEDSFLPYIKRFFFFPY